MSTPMQHQQTNANAKPSTAGPDNGHPSPHTDPETPAISHHPRQGNAHAAAAPQPQPGAPEHREGEIPKDLPKVKTWAVALAAVVALAAFAGLFYLGWRPHERRVAEAREAAAAASDDRPLVQVAQPRRADKPADLLLPADARPTQETSIYPRANGYLKKLLVDIGDRVQAGQLLAEIDAPDLEADLLAAKASLVQANAARGKAKDELELTRTTLERYESLAKGPNGGGITQQQLDERRSAFVQAKSGLDVAEADVKAADAAVTRLTALTGFTKIFAPFAGEVTARNYDVGALMVAGAASNQPPLFRITDTSTLRVSVNVPQGYLTSIAVGQKAYLSVRNYAGREFTGTIARTAGALDTATRTLRVQVDFDNKDGALFAGMYGQLRLPAAADARTPITVPTSALVFDASGTRVWVVGDDAKVHAKKVDVGRDYGTEIEVASGLNGSESIVTNPGERLSDGVEVQLPQEPTAGGTPRFTPQQALAH